MASNALHDRVVVLPTYGRHGFAPILGASDNDDVIVESGQQRLDDRVMDALIAAGGESSKPALADATGLDHAQVHDAIRRLIKTGQARQARGRGRDAIYRAIPADDGEGGRYNVGKKIKPVEPSPCEASGERGKCRFYRECMQSADVSCVAFSSWLSDGVADGARYPVSKINLKETVLESLQNGYRAVGDIASETGIEPVRIRDTCQRLARHGILSVHKGKGRRVFYGIAK